MSKYIVIHNSADCIGCKSCEVQCRHLHKGGPGTCFCRVLDVYQDDTDRPRQKFIYTSCFHCKKPWCVKACPTGAMRRRTEDGIVYVESDVCVGCKACIEACPWTVPQWNAQTGKVNKCDLCKDRIDQGLKPACVTTCAMSCLYFTTPAKASEKRPQSYAMQVHGKRP